MTPEQKAIGQAYSAKAMAAINDDEKFNKTMEEFEEWKKKEGLKL